MNNEILDLPEFLERVQDDKELLVELLEIYTEDYKDKRVALGKATEEGDFEAIKSVAHSLKGASGNISAKKVRKTLIEFEEMGKNSDCSKAPELLAELDKGYEALLECIEQVKEELE